MRAIFDYDLIAYRAASAGETRTIKAYHPITGDSWSCKTRTELYGHWQKKDKGLLAEHNKLNGTEYKADELVITDIQTPEKIANVLHTTKSMIESVLYALKTNKFNGYLGKGDSWRVERSTLLKYKGTRDDTLRPLLLGDVRDYIIKKYGAEVVEGLESDDWVTIDAYRDKSKVVVSSDKDSRGTECLVYNPFSGDPIIDCSGYGHLYLNGKSEVKGYGRQWFYFQLAGDSADNYKANCFSDLDFGDKSMYKVLKDCKNDKESLQAVSEAFQLMYPEPKIITGWRGNEFEIDWKYVLNEMWSMAHMLRKPEGDYIVGTDIMTKLEVEIKYAKT